MGSPNSTSASNDPLYALLVHGDRPSTSVLRAKGIDTAQLKAKFDEVRPKLKYFGMFKPLAEFFSLPHKQYALEHLKDEELRLRECIQLPLSRKFRGSSDLLFEYRVPASGQNLGHIAQLNLFLTKKGLWTSLITQRGPALGDLADFRTWDSVEGVVACVDAFMETYAADWQYESLSAAQAISFSLDELVDRLVDERARQLDSLKRLQGVARLKNQITYGES